MSSHDCTQRIEKRVEKDFYDFFTGKYVDMLPYIYAEPSDAYKRIVNNCKDYYIFGDEVDNIEQNKDKLTKYLENVEDIIEIGPGFDLVMSKKTLPVISYAKELKRYFAVDSSASYLKEACQFLKNKTSNIEIHAIEADLMSDKAIRLNQLEKPNGFETKKRCLLLFGGFLGNLTDDQRSHALKKLHDMIDVDDLAILTADTNLNEESVLKAYTGEEFSDFGRCALLHFAKINPDFHQHVMSFDLKYKWNEQEKCLQRYYVANRFITFKYGKFGDVKIEKGKELSGYKTRKEATKDVVDLLEKYFNVVDILSVSDRMKTFEKWRNKRLTNLVQKGI